MSASTRALAAVRAHKNERKWGLYAALRYVSKQGAQREYGLLCAFEARRKS